MNMFQIESGAVSSAELKAVAALFYRQLSADPVFRAAFPDPALGRSHCRSFVDAYAQEGEIHRVYEDGSLVAAALWSLPGQSVPSPTWDFSPEEPCCKLYLMASRRPGAGSALLQYAAVRGSLSRGEYPAADGYVLKVSAEAEHHGYICDF